MFGVIADHNRCLTKIGKLLDSLNYVRLRIIIVQRLEKLILERVTFPGVFALCHCYHVDACSNLSGEAKGCAGNAQAITMLLKKIQWNLP